LCPAVTDMAFCVWTGYACMGMSRCSQARNWVKDSNSISKDSMAPNGMYICAVVRYCLQHGHASMGLCHCNCVKLSALNLSEEISCCCERLRHEEEKSGRAHRASTEPVRLE
jgi:hypothetical protein